MPSPATTSRIGRIDVRIARTARSGRLTDLEAADRQARSRRTAPARAGRPGEADGTAARPSRPLYFAQTRRGVRARSRRCAGTRRASRVSRSISVVAQRDVFIVVREVAVLGPAQLVRGAVLVDQPRHLVRMADEIRRELRGDHEIDRPAVALAEIEQPPRRRVRENFPLRIPLEGDADELGVDSRAQRAAGPARARGFRRRPRRRAPALRRPRRCGCSLTWSLSHVAWRNLIMSPSATTYSLPSSRISPWSRHAASDPRASSASYGTTSARMKPRWMSRVDLAGGFLRRRSARNRPRAAFVLADGEERHVAEQIVGGADHAIES